MAMLFLMESISLLALIMTNGYTGTEKRISCLIFINIQKSSSLRLAIQKRFLNGMLKLMFKN